MIRNCIWLVQDASSQHHRMLFLLSSFYNCRCKLFCRSSSSCCFCCCCCCRCCWVDVVVVAAMCNCCCEPKPIANANNDCQTPSELLASFVAASQPKGYRYSGGRDRGRDRDRGRSLSLKPIQCLLYSLLLTVVHCSCPMSANSSAFLSACSVNTQTHSNWLLLLLLVLHFIAAPFGFKWILQRVISVTCWNF